MPLASPKTGEKPITLLDAVGQAPIVGNKTLTVRVPRPRNAPAEHELSPIRLHDMRHACASLLLAQGVAPRVIVQILGHSQISLPINTYSHILPTTSDAAALALDTVISDRDKNRTKKG